jgi:ADP-heptose:LPS heptosyltransferase
MKEVDISTIKTIGIYGCGLIGDLLIRTSFIEALAKAIPDAKMIVIVDKGREELLATHPDIDEIISFNRNQKKPWFRYVKHFVSFLWTLRSKKFDLFINLYGGGSSATIVKSTQAKHRWGFYHNSAQEKAYTFALPWPDFCGHWGKTFGLLLAPLGLSPKDLRAGTTFFPTKKAFEQLAEIIEPPYILVNLGAGDPRKTWTMEKYAKLIQYLISEYHFKITVFINPWQEYLTDNLKSYFDKDENAIHYISSKSLDVAGAIIQRSKFFITGDTGLLHLSFGIKAPTLALFTHTRPEHVMPEDGLVVACYAEQSTGVDRCGYPLLIHDFPLEIAINGAKKLIEALS